ncbi:hypothetical protein IU501_27000 [Nocardia otitidiscaviarum]|uniref:hypothetical protein n=1 Tax=Nocardia otitidiscaviarum TaxID=1823 RepID=UPI00130D6C69|nr:hypothetical protein [Nocardia otitidiscaviarum]MBF6136634.1 hypothetical protein [Nocardia otitidiscaviarum]MBF6484837.1 hypothetical protein [Nocardia otitidiscaviarum]
MPRRDDKPSLPEAVSVTVTVTFDLDIVEIAGGVLIAGTDADTADTCGCPSRHLR